MEESLNQSWRPGANLRVGKRMRGDEQQRNFEPFGEGETIGSTLFRNLMSENAWFLVLNNINKRLNFFIDYQNYASLTEHREMDQSSRPVIHFSQRDLRSPFGANKVCHLEPLERMQEIRSVG
jgi:hypothetical protein